MSKCNAPYCGCELENDGLGGFIRNCPHDDEYEVVWDNTTNYGINKEWWDG